MNLSDVREFVFPQAERDPGLRAEVARLATRSLYIIGGVNIGLPLASLPIAIFVANQGQALHPNAEAARLWSLFIFFAWGALTIAAARISWVSRRPRLAACISGLGSSAILILFPLLMFEGGLTGQLAVETGISLLFVQLVGVAVIPLLPVHMFTFSAAMVALYIGCAAWVSGWTLTLESFSQNHALHVLPLASVLCTALSAVNYHRLVATYRAHQETIQAQSRLLQAESAASMGRLTAALSHELNTPAGALRSAIETLSSIARKKTNAAEGQLQRLETAEADLRGVALGAAARVQETVGRIQRLTNLDRAEILAVDVNEMVQDIASTVESETTNAVRLTTKLGPLPKLTLRPQHVSASLSQILRHAVEAAGTDGIVSIQTRLRDARVEIEIEHSGNGLPASEIGKLFDPTFEVKDHRIAAGNWDLFTARQMIRENGGDIRGAPTEADGIALVMTLPTSFT